MSKFLFFLCFSILTISAFSQVEGSYDELSIEQAKKSGEALVFEKNKINLGTIKKGSFPEMTFRFLNISNQVLEYSFFDICSCSKLTYDENAKIKPGEEGVFHIVFDSKEREDEEPVEVNFELKNIDKRSGMGFFYTVNYLYKFAK